MWPPSDWRICNTTTQSAAITSGWVPITGHVATEVVAHLAALPGAEVRGALDIEARLRGPIPDHVVHIVTESRYASQFQGHGFERE